MKLSRRERVLLVVFGTLLILVTGVKLLVEPAYNVWRETNIRAGILDSLDQTAGSAIVGEAAESSLEAAAFFLPYSTPESFHRYIQGFVRESGLTVEAVTVTEQSGELPSSFSVMGIQLSATGTQAQAMRLLNGLEQENKAIVVERMDMLPARGKGEVELTVRLRVYCVKGQTDEDSGLVPGPSSDTGSFHFAE